MARHALGLPNKQRTTYRNHFCIGPAGDGYAEWEQLVSQKLAVKQTSKSKLWGENDMFHLTLAGAKEVLESNEHISKEDAAMMQHFEGTL